MSSVEQLPCGTATQDSTQARPATRVKHSSAAHASRHVGTARDNVVNCATLPNQVAHPWPSYITVLRAVGRGPRCRLRRIDTIPVEESRFK